MRSFAMVVGLALASSASVAAGPSTEPHARVRAGTDGSRPDVAVRRLAVPEARVEIGVSIRDLDPEQMEDLTGARVEDVRSGSPAEKAGIRQGDVITSFDDERVRSARHLSRLVEETPAGRTVDVSVTREGQPLALSVTPERGAVARGGLELFERPRVRPVPPFRYESRPFELPGWPDHEGPFELYTAPGRTRLGIGVQELTPQLAEYFGAAGGVLVASVEPDSPAASAGLQAGDVITAVNGEPIENAGALAAEVARAKEGAELSIEYQRDGQTATATAMLPDRGKPRARRIVRPV